MNRQNFEFRGRSSSPSFFIATLCCLLAIWTVSSSVSAQSVCLPLPRLLSLMPMGGTHGTSFEVNVTGENLEDSGELLFQNPGVTAAPKKDANGKLEPNKYIVTIAPDVPPGLIEARITSRLGISSARIFQVGHLPELICNAPNTSLATALPLPINSVCNAVVTAKAIDHYAFDAVAGQRYIVHCQSRGIDSKLDPVVIVADSTGRDLVVERRGDTLDFRPTATGKHIIKVHELTFKGGPGYFYRLSLQEIPTDGLVPTFPSTQSVSAFSWPPTGLAANASTSEEESIEVQRIALPCDISGRFYPAADVDTFEFSANQGEVWWVEVASERLGRPTDPAIVIQRQTVAGTDATWADVAELNDIASPMRPSSNGYAYDGPPFDGGSTDILGKLEIKETGIYRILLSDLFGGTRRDPRNQYRLIVRKAEPDFAAVAWGLHMELRNGDRNALSKPLALRAGSTVALEVVAVRRDGFDGEIRLAMDGLPEGVVAHDLKIAAGKMRGVLLLTARGDAPQGMTQAKLTAHSVIDGRDVSHPVRIAQMAWPIPDAWSEIPYPRLVEGIPVSVTQSEQAPVTIAPVESKVWDVKQGSSAKIPLQLTRRSEFSGSVLQLKTFGHAFEGNPPFDVSLATDQSDAVLQLTAIQPAPGEYRIAFYGSAVAKYRYNPIAIGSVEAEVKRAEQEVVRIAEELQKATQSLAAAPADKKSEAEAMLADWNAKKTVADTAVSAAKAKLKTVTDQAAPRDTAEIVISEPMTIRILPKDPS